MASDGAHLGEAAARLLASQADGVVSGAGAQQVAGHAQAQHGHGLRLHVSCEVPPTVVPPRPSQPRTHASQWALASAVTVTSSHSVPSRATSLNAFTERQATPATCRHEPAPSTGKVHPMSRYLVLVTIPISSLVQSNEQPKTMAGIAGCPL